MEFIQCLLSLKESMWLLISNQCMLQSFGTLLSAPTFIQFHFFRYPIEGAVILAPLDFTKSLSKTKITEMLGGQLATVVLSDMVGLIMFVCVFIYLFFYLTLF